MSRKHQPIRWSLSHAGAEFSIDPKTLSKRLIGASIAPGNDGCYSTAQIAAVMFGDLGAARLRKMEAEAQSAELEAKRKAGEVVFRDECIFVWKDSITRCGRVFDRCNYIPRNLVERLRNEILAIADEVKAEDEMNALAEKARKARKI
jgi:phage terminase Nu1 subunit (DNA packaging protein)